jgi:hypothetical protein
LRRHDLVRAAATDAARAILFWAHARTFLCVWRQKAERDGRRQSLGHR